MASLIDELIATLQKEQVIYDELLPIAKEKTGVIVKSDIEGLQKITDIEQTYIEKLNPLENKREEVVSNIGMVLSIKKNELHITKIIEALGNQPEYQSQLDQIHKKLKSTVSKLVDVNNHNQKLIKHSLEMLEFNMNFIQSTRMMPGNNSYTKGASSYEGAMPQSGIFDAKQ